MRRRPPRFTRTGTLFPYRTRFRARPASSSTGCRARTWPTPDATRGSAAPMDKDAPILNALVVEAARVIVGDPKVAAQPWDKYALVAWYGEGVSTLNGFRYVGEEPGRSEEHTSELQSLMRISYAVFCLKKKTKSHTRK